MNIKDFLNENKSILAIGAGLVLSTIGCIFTAKATLKSKEKIDYEKKLRGMSKDEKLPVKDVIKLCWPDWLPVIFSYGGSYASILTGKSIDNKIIKELTPLSVAYEIGEKFANEYSKEVVKQIGEDKEKEIRTNAIKTLSAPTEEFALYDGETYFWEPCFGRLFISSTNKIDNAINIFNARLNDDQTGAYNDLFDEILNQTPCQLNSNLICDIGEFVGFHKEKGLLKANYSESIPITLSDGRIISAIILKLESISSGQSLFPTTFYEYV